MDFSADDPRPVPHAWTTDQAGAVVDLTTLRRDDYFGVPIPSTVYRRCVARDGIARPVLPLLMDAGWTPAMPDRDALAVLARAARVPARSRASRRSAG